MSPFLVRGRIFLQELWLLKLDWDDVIDDKRLKMWTKFEEEVRPLNELSFPRCYRKRSEAASDYQLHVFSGRSIKRNVQCAFRV